jgi:hypothetical protein
MTVKALLVLALCLVGVASSYGADNPLMGTWKLNEAKSKAAPGQGKSSTVTYEMSGDDIKCTIDGTGPDGAPIHNEWTGKFDGKDYPVTGDPTSDMRAYKKINSHEWTVVAKKDGKVTETVNIVVSANGKTRTVSAHGIDARGMKFSIVSVYDKQ